MSATFVWMMVNNAMHKSGGVGKRAKPYVEQYASLVESDVIAKATAAEINTLLAAVEEYDGFMDLKMCALQSMFRVSALTDCATSYGRSRRLPEATQRRVIDVFMRDVVDWAGARTFVELAQTRPAWLEKWITHFAETVEVYARIMPVDTPLVNSRYMYPDLRNKFGRAASTGDISVQDISGDDVCTVGLKSPDSEFAFIVPYVYSKTSGRNNVEVAAYCVIEIGYAQKLKEVFPRGISYTLHSEDPRSLTAVKYEIGSAMQDAHRVVLSVISANNFLLGESTYFTNTADKFIERYFGNDLSREDRLYRNAVDTLVTVKLSQTQIASSSLSTVVGDIKEAEAYKKLADIGKMSNAAIREFTLRYKAAPITLSADITRKAAASVKAALAAKKKQAAKSYNSDDETSVSYLEELLDAVKSA
jgi:hypothetical protein